MLNCLHCELVRAKAKATALSLLGWTPEHTAKHLSECYGETYYVEFGTGSVGWTRKLYRASKLPPYTPHLIREYE